MYRSKIFFYFTILAVLILSSLAISALTNPAPEEQMVSTPSEVKFQNASLGSGTILLSANQISDQINKNGRAILYDILFDFGKTDINPDSEGQLAEIAKVLHDNPNLYVFITGHTDNVGMLNYNLRLSQRRAQAVVMALVTQYGIDPERLVPRGIGQLAPLASNETDEGRSKNRRVEIVEMVTPIS